jgi:hypothetical protein
MQGTPREVMTRAQMVSLEEVFIPLPAMVDCRTLSRRRKATDVAAAE